MRARGQSTGELDQRLKIRVALREGDVRGLQLPVRGPHLGDRVPSTADVLPHREHHRDGRQREGDEPGDPEVLVGDIEGECEWAGAQVIRRQPPEPLRPDIRRRLPSAKLIAEVSSDTLTTM